MKELDGKILQFKNFFKEMSDDLRKEQRELFFHKKSREEENEYFGFFKFLFQSPDKRMGF
jgi:hypothetical protein